MKLFGVPIKVDDTMLNNKLKFVHPDGREEIIDITDNKPRKVIEGTDLLTNSPETSTSVGQGAIAPPESNEEKR